jgi:hypothetical protein
VSRSVSKARSKLRGLTPARDAERLDAQRAEVSWCELLRWVFATDVRACPCGGRRTVVAVVVDSAMARAVLASLGLSCAPATFTPARAPPPIGPPLTRGATSADTPAEQPRRLDIVDLAGFSRELLVRPALRRALRRIEKAVRNLSINFVSYACPL